MSSIKGGNNDGTASEVGSKLSSTTNRTIKKHCFLGACTGKLIEGSNASKHFKAHSTKLEGEKNEENVKNCSPQNNGD